MSKSIYAKAAELIAKSRMTVALTGAGISTPSGIPDFRSPGCGIWERVDPMEVASIEGFRRNPVSFFKFIKPLAEKIDSSEPNEAHKVLATWEHRKQLRSVITQNIDNLHQKAGSVNVLELHGNSQRAFCVDCGRAYTHAELLEKLEICNVPHCECAHGGIIKPDLVLFGENLPIETLRQAEHDCENCELIIVAGSSLTVSPASILPRTAVNSGSKLIVINMQETYIDSKADVIIRDRVERAFPEIEALLNQ